MTRRCAWCKRLMGSTQGGARSEVTDGICPTCNERVLSAEEKALDRMLARQREIAERLEVRIDITNQTLAAANDAMGITIEGGAAA